MRAAVKMKNVARKKNRKIERKIQHLRSQIILSANIEQTTGKHQTRMANYIMTPQTLEDSHFVFILSFGFHSPHLSLSSDAGKFCPDLLILVFIYNIIYQCSAYIHSLSHRMKRIDWFLYLLERSTLSRTIFLCPYYFSFGGVGGVGVVVFRKIDVEQLQYFPIISSA